MPWHIKWILYQTLNSTISDAYIKQTSFQVKLWNDHENQNKNFTWPLYNEKKLK